MISPDGGLFAIERNPNKVQEGRDVIKCARKLAIHRISMESVFTVDKMWPPYANEFYEGDIVRQYIDIMCFLMSFSLLYHKVHLIIW